MPDDTSKTPAGNDSRPDQSATDAPQKKQPEADREKEIGGRGGLDPTRYGDWEKDGRCIDF